MKTQLPLNPFLRCTLTILTFLALSTCQKQIVSPQKIVAQAQNYFETKILTDSTQKVYDNNPRHTVTKEPVWAEASVQNMPFGEAVVVPLVYEQAIALQTQSGNIPLGELSYLLIYKDAQKQYHSEVVTKLPEKNYWPNYKNPNTPFKGVILVEDWWGNTIRNIGLGIAGPENLLGYVAPQAKGQIPPNNNLMLAEQFCYSQVWQITVCGGGAEGCTSHYDISQVCFTVYTDSGPSGGGGGNWSGLPTGPDYGNMPHGGAGGYNTPPPPPPNYLADITNNVTNPCLKAVVQNLKLANVAGELSKIISGLDKSTLVKINVRDSINSRDGRPANSFGFKYFSATNVFSATILLNRETLLENSMENVTSVIIHEFVHAYFNYINKVPRLEDEIEHEEMAQKYTKPMAEFLTNLFGISAKDATALAWSGLQDAKSYLESEVFAYTGGTMTKAEMESIYSSYVTNFSGKPVCSVLGVE